jgi:hypothetical protein
MGGWRRWERNVSVDMKISEKKRNELYGAIHEAIVDVRIALKLPANGDYTLAQVENKIWQDQKRVLGLK